MNKWRASSLGKRKEATVEGTLHNVAKADDIICRTKLGKYEAHFIFMQHKTQKEKEKK